MPRLLAISLQVRSACVQLPIARCAAQETFVPRPGFNFGIAGVSVSIDQCRDRIVEHVKAFLGIKT